MIGFLAPAVVVALLGIILQGIKAGVDLHDHRRASEAARRQSNIALFVALMQLTEATSHSPGEVLEIKERLVMELLSDVLPEKVFGVLGLAAPR